MRPSSLKMLIVDDDKFISTLIQDFFSSSGPNYTFFTAEDGHDALVQCLEKKPDIIIADLILPKMSGVELISNLRKMPEFAVTPIIAITMGSDEVVKQAITAGAHMVLRKPIHKNELLQKVDDLLMASPFLGNIHY